MICRAQRRADGSCTFSERIRQTKGSAPLYVETTGENLLTCQRHVRSGEMTKEQAAKLSVQGGKTTKASSVPSNSSQSSQTTSELSARAVEGSRWVDPLGVVITSLSIDLAWRADFVTMLGANYNITSDEFPYDGWGDSGTPQPPIQFGNGYALVEADEAFANADFEMLLLSIAATSGPAAVAAVYAACGFDVSLATFYHYEYMEGVFDGTYYWGYNDTKSGGCSDLVHGDSFNCSL